ncbi:MAG: CHAD domain-containing protein [Bacteroidales bacterium]|nr:CHAD domain-containing protein [Bacteroidales bacterium]
MSKKDQSFRLYLLENLTKFEENYRNAVISLDEDAIHDYRVALKKLRTLNLFLKESGLERTWLKSSLKGFKKIFKIGGAIRDFQVFKNLTREYEIKLSTRYTTFLDYLDVQIPLVWELFIENSAKILSRLEKGEWKNIVGADFGYKDNQVHLAALKFIWDKMDAANEILKEENLDDYQLHQIRKILKQIRFIYEMRMAEEWKKPEHQLHLELLKKLETILGIWHDKVTMLLSLKNFLDQLSDQKEKSMYNSLEKKLIKEIKEGVIPLKPEFKKEYKWFKKLT